MADVNLNVGLKAKTLPAKLGRKTGYGELRSKEQAKKELVDSIPLSNKKAVFVPLLDQVNDEEAFFVSTSSEAVSQHNSIQAQSVTKTHTDELTHVFVPAETALEILPGCSYDQLMRTLNSILAQDAIFYTAFKINDVMQKWGMWSASKQRTVIDTICKIVKKFPQITDLELQHNKMDAKTGSYLIEQLSAHKINLKRLNLSGNELGKYMVVSTDVSKFLQNLGEYVANTQIESVCLSRNSFKAKDSMQVMNEMGHALSVRPPFQALTVTLDGNDLTTDSMQRAELVKWIYETACNFPRWSVQLNNCNGLTKSASSFLKAVSSLPSDMINCESTKDREQLYQKLNEKFSCYFKETFLHNSNTALAACSFASRFII